MYWPLGLILKVQFKRLVCKSKPWDLQASFNTLMLCCWLLISCNHITLLNEVYRVSASQTHMRTYTDTGSRWTSWKNSLLNTYRTGKEILQSREEPCHTSQLEKNRLSKVENINRCVFNVERSSSSCPCTDMKPEYCKFKCCHLAPVMSSAASVCAVVI